MRVAKLKSFFEGRKTKEEIEEALAPELEKINLANFREEVRSEVRRLENIINTEKLPNDKPVKYLVSRLCYLSLSPFCPDPTKMLEQYKPLAQWHRNAKQYLRDFKTDSVTKEVKLLKDVKRHELMAEDCVKDAHIAELVDLKNLYVKSLEKRAQKLTSGGDADVETMQGLLKRMEGFKIELHEQIT